MRSEILGSAAVGKLKGILKDRYGKGLRVNFMQDVSSFQLEEDGFLLARGDLLIPIHVNNKYLATAIVEKAADLGFKEFETLAQLVRLFLEPEIYNWYVKQMIHNSKSEISSDIRSIFQPFVFDSEKPAQTVTTNVLCLESHNPHLISRLSHEIHEISNRWACLRFKDVQTQISTADDLRSLGGITLVIDDILELSPFYQGILQQALMSAKAGEEPLFVVGCLPSLADLESRNMIQAGLVPILKAHRLEIERLPKDPKLLQESLEFMLEF